MNMTAYHKADATQTILYTQNKDWTCRELKDDQEIIKFQNDSNIRVWYNEQTQGFAMHWHSALEIIMPIENYYDIITPMSNYHVLPGEVIIIPPGTMHQLLAPSMGKRFIFLLEITDILKCKGFSCIQSVLNECLYITPCTHSQIYDTFYQLLLQMRNEYFSHNEYRELTIYAQLIQLFVLLSKNQLSINNAAHHLQVTKSHENLQSLNAVLDYISIHYMENLTLDEVASYSGFSKFHFTKLFKQYTGSTFYEHLSFIRLKSAECLLINPELPITEIALRSGFSTLCTFNRTFKQHHNCTPTAYRKLYQEMYQPYDCHGGSS